MNLRDFIIDSDYPMDFIVWKGSGSVSSSNLVQSTLTIAHGLGFAPLLFGQFSLDGGSTWLPLGVIDFYSNKVDVWAEADNTNAYVYLTSFSGTKTAQVRLWGLMPTTASKKVAVPSGSDKYRLNTDFNYSKLVAAGRHTISTGTQTIYAHNLGYVPEVMTWYETTAGRIRDGQAQFSGNTTYYPTQVTTIDSTKLSATFSSATNGSTTYRYIHYRIYGDKNG